METIVELEEKAKNKKKTYCLKYIPNWIRRYSLAKQLEEKTDDVRHHNKIEFRELYRLISLVGMNYFPLEGFVHFDSRKVAHDELLKALEDDQINMIGLYGMGGCGKTMLVKKVGQEVEKRFDKVVLVSVSNTINVQEIQGGIASQLGLELKEEDKQGRARRLSMGLSIGKRFLIILDDVWEELDFEAIGIPKDKRQKGCIVLITTRRRCVCTLMECQIKIPLHVLNEIEALTLFHKHAKISDDNFENLKVLAQDIAKECGGLPVAIAAVASTLKEKHQSDWEEALETLRDSSWVDIEEGMRQTYSCLQLSYDYLNNVVAESLFLLCSAFPEDYNISEEDLTKLGIGLGLAGEVGSYKRARNRISIAKDKLIDSCLLQETRRDGFFDKKINSVKMHDLVRDVALWIAKKKNKLIMGPERSQKSLQENMIMKDDKVRYLWIDHNVDEFPTQLDCPELEFLCISTVSHFESVKDCCFKGMKKLKVLLLKNIGMRVKLPKSNYLIDNIRCLILSTWSLGDISFIGSLEKLQSLSLTNCSLDELPNNIVQQKDLRYLYLGYCEIQKNPYEVIGRCSQLEELYFIDNKGEKWEDQGENVVEFFDKNNVTPVLERYDITIGHYYYFGMQKCMNRCLFVEYFDTCISNATIMNLMQRAEVLGLKGIHSCKNVIPEVAQPIGGDMNDLTELLLYDSNEIECVIDTSHHMCNVGIMSNLTHLTIKGMKGLKTLYHGQPPKGIFAKLEVLKISVCDSLEQIIMDEVNEIVVDDSEHQRSHGSTFPKLKELVIEQCNQLEHLFPASFAHCFTQLESLRIHEADKLKSVFGPFNNGDKNPNEFQVIEFSTMKHLSFRNLPNLVAICPENYHPTWPSLQTVQLYECKQLNIMPIASSRLGQEDEIASEDLKKATVTHLNFGLKYLYLDGLPELRHIWIGPKYILFLQNLVEVYISECGNLKAIFPTSISRSLPQLTGLIIKKCSELEEIIEEDNENQSASNPPLLFPRLTEIYISHCHKLKCVFPMTSSSRVLPKLRELCVAEASQLEQLFGQKQQRNERMEDVNIPELEFLLLWKVPKLTIGGELIQLQTVKYRVVQQSPTLDLTSTLTPMEMRTMYYHQREHRIRIIKILDDVIKSYEAEVASKVASENKHTPSQHVKELEAKVESKIASESKNTPSQTDLSETIEDIVGEVSVLEIPATIASSSTDPKLINKLPNPSANDLFHQKPSHAANVKEQDAQGAQEGNMSKEKSVKGSVEEGSMSKNAKCVKGSVEGFTLENAKTFDIHTKETIEAASEIEHLSSQNFKEPEDQGDQNENISKEENVERRVEGSTSESVKIVNSLPKALLPYKQTKVNPTETCINRDIKTNPRVNLQNFENDNGQLPVTSIPIVATTKDDLVIKALADLEVCLDMPLKDIATTETNSHCLLTSLKFLSRLSLEDRALSHGLKAAIASLHQDFSSILYSFKQAFATIKKFHETQEKEARLTGQISRLEKEIEDCEVELSSLQGKKKKCVAEMREFKKEKSEMVEDQRKAQQQLFEIEFRWSVLCSQFQHNNIDMRIPQIIGSTPENVVESDEDSSRETTEQIDNKETETLTEAMHDLETPTVMENYSFAVSLHKTSQQETSVEEPEDESAQREDILQENDVKGIPEGSTSKNVEIVTSSSNSEPEFEHDGSQLPIPSSAPIVATIKDDLVAKALMDLEDSLEMPLKDITSSESKSLHLLSTLKFLSRLSLEDGVLPHGLEPIIESLHRELPTILYSFKQVFATINKFHEAQEQEARLKEQISMLEMELEDCEAMLSSLEEKKKKCVAETTEAKKQIESVTKRKSERVEGQRKAKQQIFEIDYRWSVLCSQFQLNNVAARNLS